MTDRCRLPPNASPVEHSLAEVQSRLAESSMPIRSLWDANTCPAALLPWLAWTLSVDAWDTNWSDPIKRQVILSSAQVHRTKGTVSALKHVLAAFGVMIELVEWFDAGGQRHTFTLHVPITPDMLAIPERQLTPACQRNIKQAVDAIKPVRSHYQLALTVACTQILVLAATLCARMIKVVPMRLLNNNHPGDDHAG